MMESELIIEGRNIPSYMGELLLLQLELLLLYQFSEYNFLVLF